MEARHRVAVGGLCTDVADAVADRGELTNVELAEGLAREGEVLGCDDRRRIGRAVVARVGVAVVGDAGDVQHRSGGRARHRDGDEHVAGGAGRDRLVAGAADGLPGRRTIPAAALTLGLLEGVGQRVGDPDGAGAGNVAFVGDSETEVPALAGSDPVGGVALDELKVDTLECPDHARAVVPGALGGLKLGRGADRGGPARRSIGGDVRTDLERGCGGTG